MKPTLPVRQVLEGRRFRQQIYSSRLFFSVTLSSSSEMIETAPPVGAEEITGDQKNRRSNQKGVWVVNCR